MGVAEAKERMVRENRGYELMSLDLTGEPFPSAMDDDKRKRLEAAGWRVGSADDFLRASYMRCSNGHIDIWYDSTDSDKCPLCAVRERAE